MNSNRGAAAVPLFAGDNRENSGFVEVMGDARREADRQDFLAIVRAGDDSVETRHALALGAFE